MVTQSEWQARLTQVVADQVRRYRNERGWSAQQLAARCEQMGFAMPRPVLSNLENGRRESITWAELLALSRALEVPPVLLVAPLGHAGAIEISPGHAIGTWDAFRWFVGEAELQESPAGLEAVPTGHKPADAIRLFREHDDLLERWRDAAARLAEWRSRWPEVLRDPTERRIIEAEYGPDPASANIGSPRPPMTEEYLVRAREEQLREREDLARSGLRSVREVMRHADLTPPPIPRELANLPGERSENTWEARPVSPSRGWARRQAEPDLEPEAGG